MKAKLTSRKFWVAAASILSGVLMLFNFADSTIETITSAVLIVGPALGYMFVEYRLDAKSIHSAVDAIVEVIQAFEKDDETKDMIKRLLK